MNFFKKYIGLFIVLFAFSHSLYAKQSFRVEKKFKATPFFIDIQNYPSSYIYTIDSVYKNHKLQYVVTTVFDNKQLLLAYQNYSTLFYFSYHSLSATGYTSLCITSPNFEIDYFNKTHNSEPKILHLKSITHPPKSIIQNSKSITHHSSSIIHYSKFPSTDIKNNDWDHHYYGILFTPLGSDGTLGDMGETQTDHLNYFNGSYDNNTNQNNADRLYRFVNGSGTAFPSKICTNQITQAQSGSNIINNEYQVFPTSPQTIPSCADIYTITPLPAGLAGNELKQATEIINDSLSYYANPNVAQWLAEKKLFAHLDADSIAMATNTILAAFYATKKLSPTGAIQAADVAMRPLYDISIQQDAASFAQALLEAKQANASNTGTADYEVYEKTINELYYKTIEYGSKSVDATEKTTIETLAKSCPLLNGSAVYKARTLWSYWEPWLVYEDLWLCNNIAQNKNNSGNPFDFVLNGLSDTSNNNAINHIPIGNEFTNVQAEVKVLNNATNFSISPNPTAGNITIRYRVNAGDQASINIYNSLGQLVQQIELASNVQLLYTQLTDISNGVYQYQYIVNGKVIKTDELIILK